MQNLLTELKTLLATQPRFTQEGRMIKQAVIDAAQSLDAELLQLLISHDAIKRHFFQDVGGILVFDKVKLLRFVSNKAFLEDSYTAFKNKIGLVTKNSDGLYDAYLSDAKEVVLAYPYKDCMLEGGQTKEEQKRTEVFWNETLAPDDIDRLKEPKAFSNIKRYDTEGVHENVTDLSLNDNYIIKGNNLLALYSLLPVYRGKVKLIYIDPPYNTGNDSFRYNDSFNHSTWLTFMKDRLKVARELLSSDGVIFVHCDNNEQAYLKVMLDEIFKKEQFIDSITIVNNPRGRDYGGIANMHEFIHIFSKSQLEYEMYKVIDEDKEFPFKDNLGPYEIRELRNRNTAFNDKNRPNLCYPFYVNPKNEIDNGFLEISIEPKIGFIEVMPAKSQGIQTVWRWGKDKALENLNINIVGKSMNEDGRYMIVEKYRENSRLARSVWWDKEVNSERGTVHLRELFGNKVFSFPKPETLITRIIEISTRENDIVLDFHLGSGTTATTAHKMKRKYIGIEQMDYIENIAVERLKKVIEGEQGGISKSVNWQGGGSFVYMELAKANQHFVEQIEAANTEGVLLEIWERMKAEAFISYKVTPDMIDKNIKEYEALSFEDKKRFLIETLDKNLLYVPHCDMESKEMGMSETDKAATTAFYNLKNEA